MRVAGSGTGTDHTRFRGSVTNAPSRNAQKPEEGIFQHPAKSFGRVEALKDRLTARCGAAAFAIASRLQLGTSRAISHCGSPGRRRLRARVSTPRWYESSTPERTTRSSGAAARRDAL